MAHLTTPYNIDLEQQLHMCLFFKKNTMTFRPKDQSIKLSSLDAMNNDDGKRGKKVSFVKSFCVPYYYTISLVEKKSVWWNVVILLKRAKLFVVLLYMWWGRKKQAFPDAWRNVITVFRESDGCFAKCGLKCCIWSMKSWH